MVLALAEHDEGALTETTEEMLTLARGLAADTGTSLDVAVFGDGDDVVSALGEYGADAVHVVQHDDLGDYAPDAWAASLEQLAGEVDADALVAPGTDRGHEVLARLAARGDLPMAANCLEVSPGDTYTVTRQRWGGSIMEHAELESDPAVLTVAPHEVEAEPAAEPGEAAVEAFTPTLEDSDLRVRVSRIEESDEEGVPLQEARVVVGGGRGVGGPEDFDQLEELADLLGGTVGASRAAVNEGWRPHDDQIGLTGAKISPDVYIAAGISGAVQHMVGCKGAKNILAINTDDEAAIIQKAEYAIIGDLHEVVPAIVEEVEASQ